MTHRLHIRSPPALPMPSTTAPITSPTVLVPVKKAATYAANSTFTMMRAEKKLIRSKTMPNTGIDNRRTTEGTTTVSTAIIAVLALMPYAGLPRYSTRSGSSIRFPNPISIHAASVSARRRSSASRWKCGSQLRPGACTTDNGSLGVWRCSTTITAQAPAAVTIATHHLPGSALR